MNYKLNSQNLEHPLLKPILKDLIPVFKKLEINFFIIGATARDIVLQIHGEKSGRRTQDIDFAIAIDKWEKFDELEVEITKQSNFRKDKEQKQRFLFNEDFQVDIVPFGKIAEQKDKIFWPPDQSIMMSILGFNEVSENTIEVSIDEIKIKVASLLGIFLLKLVAWKDRHLKGNKDADDIGFILSNYISIYDQKAATHYYDEIYNREDFSLIIGSAILIGIELNELLEKENRIKIKDIIQKEITKRESSILFNQIHETNKIDFDEIVEAFSLMIKYIN